MISLGPIIFLMPIVLLGLLALPLLWWLLRATPPAPSRLRFPGVGLLLGLQDKEKTPDRTPLWLLLLRMLAIASAILAFAEPVVNAQNREQEQGPLLVLMDGGWASAPDWEQRIGVVENLLDEAARDGRPTVFISLAHGFPAGAEMPFRDAKDWVPVVRALSPQPFVPDRVGFVEWLADKSDGFSTVWLSDGLEYGSDLAKTLANIGPLRILDTPHSPLGLQPLQVIDGQLVATIIALAAENDREITVTAIGTAPNGVEVILAQTLVGLPRGDVETMVAFDLPLELRNRVTRVVITSEKTAGAVALADDGLRKRKVALIGVDAQEGSPLVQPMHYLRRALQPSVALIEGDLGDVLLSAPDVIILSDVGKLSSGSSERLQEWVTKGGLLVRFAGPKLAAVGIGGLDADPLLPVRLRAGGRNLGGAMSWGTPKHLQDFPVSSPFFGLHIPDDVVVSAQVVAQPDPNLTARTLAALKDGTPLVTHQNLGKGRVVLFHITANAEWSTLPLSGLFVQMLERLSISTVAASEVVAQDARMWVPENMLDGFGVLHETDAAPVSGDRLARAVAADALPGIYRAADMGIAVNVQARDTVLQALKFPVEVIGDVQEKMFKPWLLLAALGLFMLDIIGTLWLTGKMRNRNAIQVAGLLLFVGVFPLDTAQAQDALALRAANETVLAYIKTGDPAVDRASAAGMLGLSTVLFTRTSIEPATPVGVDVETDELAFFPFLYWPITESQKPLSSEAVDRLNRYMRHGGMILFDTRDAHLGSAFGTGTVNGRVLKRLTARLEIPPLGPVGDDHVLTRAFYLMQDFPGRWSGANVWVEASAGALNDGVTPVVIGAHDWAAAWAVSDSGQPMFPVGRGVAGQRQREMARRFGVNLVMYVMTGNYKSDQVHIPALLERLGE